MERRPWIVYALSDPRIGEIRYVGVTFRKHRFAEHLSRARKGGRTHRDCWVRSLLVLGLRPLFVELERGIGEGWQTAEMGWIAYYGATGRLTNLTQGGDGTLGCVPSPETRARASKARRGKKYAPGRRSAMLGKRHSAEARAKIAAAGHRRSQSSEAKMKLAKSAKGRDMSKAVAASVRARTGKPLSKEHREKIAATTTNRRPVVCEETGERFASMTEASRMLGVSKSSVWQALRKGCRCKGRRLR